MSLQFQFASEEYPEFTGSAFNDLFAIWMNGNLVTSPIFNVTQVNSINQASTPNLIQDNTGDDFNTEMDGITVTLSVTMPVDVGEVNTLRIGIADVADTAYDSNIPDFGRQRAVDPDRAGRRHHPFRGTDRHAGRSGQ